MGHRDEACVTADAPVVGAGSRGARAARRTCRVAASSGGRTDRSGRRGRRPRRPRRTRRRARAGSLRGPAASSRGARPRPRVGLGDVEIDRPRRRAARRPAQRSARDARRSVAPGRASRGGVPGLSSRPVLRVRPPPAGPGPSDPVLVGRSVHLAGRREPVGVGLAQLEGVEAIRGLVRAVAGPCLDTLRGLVEQLVEPLDLVRRELGQDVVPRVPHGSPMPTRSRLNCSVPSSSMIERRPL